MDWDFTDKNKKVTVGGTTLSVEDIKKAADLLDQMKVECIECGQWIQLDDKVTCTWRYRTMVFICNECLENTANDVY